MKRSNFKTILVVDDTPENLKLLKNILVSQKYIVKTAPSGELALRSLEMQLPDLILLDIMMPGLSGFEVCEKLKENDCTREIPVIFISALSEVEDKVKAFGVGGVDYIPKPFQSEEVLARVATHLDLQEMRVRLKKKNVLLHKELINRIEVEAELQQSRDNLEIRVQERIVELARINRELMDEISKRLHSEKKRKQLEELLQKTQKMEAIGTLAGGIAHDFNNILTAIIGYSELVCDDFSGDEEQRDHVFQILQAGLRAKGLVQQILSFSRHHNLKLSAIVLGPIIKEVLKLMRATLPATISIEMEIDSEADKTSIMADSLQIHQILMNLCVNAGHAMNTTLGTLKISLERVNVKCEISDQYPSLGARECLCLTVADTGHGMTEEVKDRIFDPYFTTKKSGEGTGLGLAVVQGIVKHHRGAITVESEVGSGTTFRVYFPTLAEASKGEQSLTKALLKGGNEYILMVDDEASNADLAKSVLSHVGYNIVVKTDSREALSVFKLNPELFDLVITDLTMPHMTGEQLAAEMLIIRPEQPIILCSGYHDKIAEKQNQNVVFHALLSKPVSMDELTETVRKVLDKSTLS